MKFNKTNIKDMAVIIIMGALIFGFSAFFIISGDNDYSITERRALAQPPEISAERLESGRFMTDFESYTLDQFPLRDTFRTIKALTVTYIFGQKDCNGFYTSDGYIASLEYPMNDSMVTNAANKFNKIYDKYIASTDCKTYLSVIPDKNYFLAKESGRPSMDYEKFIDELRRQTKFKNYIDIVPLIKKEYFYKTDQHWRQEKLYTTAQKLAESMGVDVSDEYIEKDADVQFKGTYIGQSALPHRPDNIKYLTNEALEGCKVTSYDKGAPAPSAIYDFKKANGKDAYEMFLGGADALIVIENPNTESDKELIMFRDSFGSSLAPLLVPGYSKITMIDIRYINSDMLGNFVEFSSQDVLFIYSTLVLNNSISLK